MSYACVVFDLDGVLVDSAGCWTKAEQLAVAELGGTWRPEVRDDLIGHGPEQAAVILAAGCGLEGQEERLAQAVLDHALEVFAADVRPQPGAAAALTAVARLAPVGVATNAPRSLALTSLEAAGLAALAPVVLAPEDVAEPKPAPDVYLAACAALGAPPQGSLAVEDSAPGVASAVAAGMRVLFYGPSTQAPDGAAGAVASLDELPALVASGGRD